MDGNRRWARKQGLAPYTGHKKGTQAVKTAINFCLEKQIHYLSLYTFSLENFKRNAYEQSYLFDLLAHMLETDITELINNNIKIRFIGDRSLFPATLSKAIEQAEQRTRNHSGLQLLLMFCYGSRQEILAAANSIIHDVLHNKLTGPIGQQQFTDYLWTTGIPDPDVIIRTGKNARLSNFLLLQAAYSELYFLDCFWPELTKEHLQQVFDNYTTQQRNFGA